VVTTALILTFSPAEKGQRLHASLYAVVRRANPVAGAWSFRGSRRESVEGNLTVALQGEEEWVSALLKIDSELARGNFSCPVENGRLVLPYSQRIKDRVIREVLAPGERI
jgi:hypothetical protein